MLHLPTQPHLLRPEWRKGPSERTYQQTATKSPGVLGDRGGSSHGGEVACSSLQVEAFQKPGGQLAETGARDSNLETSFVP